MASSTNGNAGDTFSYQWMATDDSGNTVASGETTIPQWAFTTGEQTHLNVSCTVIDDDGLSASGSTSFNVEDPGPELLTVDAPDEVPEWSPVTVTAQVVDGDASADTFSYKWNVTSGGGSGGGSVSGTASGNTYTFMAGEADQYNVECTVTDDDGKSASGSAAVNVYGIPPSNVGIAAQPSGVYEYQSITLSGSFADVDKTSPGESFTYSWTVKDPLGDEVASGSGLTLPMQAGMVPGTYTASFTVTDDDDLSASDSATFVVLPPAIQTFGYGIFDIRDHQFDDTVLSFSEKYVFGHPAPSALIDWGDGEDSGGNVVQDGVDANNGTYTGHVTALHTYQQEGVYAITVIVVDSSYYATPQLDFFSGVGTSMAKIGATDEDQGVETAAASGATDVFLGESGRQPDYQSQTFSVQVGGSFYFNYSDALIETYGTAAVSDYFTGSAYSTSSGTYNAKQPSSSLVVKQYTAGDGGTQVYGRLEYYWDADVALVKTDAAGGGLSDNKTYTDPAYI